MKETQRTISDWANSTFGPSGSNTELLRKLSADDASTEAIEEAADVVIVLYRLVDRMGGDMHNQIDRKMAINRTRKWELSGGHGYHLRDKTTG